MNLSIFLHDALIRRRMWMPKGKRPIVVTTGSHQKTCLFGVLSIDGRQLFRRYDTFDRYTFLDYLKKLQNKFHKVILFLDRAPEHTVQLLPASIFQLTRWLESISTASPSRRAGPSH